jgi:hypothetical protein
MAGDCNRAAATVADAEAELDVGDAVEAELRVKAAHRLGVGAPERNAVAFDRIHVWASVLFELFEGALSSQPIWPRHHHSWIRQRCEQRRDRITGQLDAGVEENNHLTRRGGDPGVDGGREAYWRVERHQSEPFRCARLQPPGHPCVAGVVDQQCFEI